MLTQSETHQLLNRPPKPSRSSLYKNILIVFLIVCLIACSVQNISKRKQLRLLHSAIATSSLPPGANLSLDFSSFGLSAVTLAAEPNATNPITVLTLSSSQTTDFSNNNLPQLTNLTFVDGDQRNRISIQNNRFDSLIGLDISEQTTVQNFTNNQLPSINNLSILAYNLQNFVNNKMENLQFLKFVNIDQGLNGNWMPNLAQLTIRKYNVKTLALRQQFPKLTKIIIWAGQISTLNESLPELDHLQINNQRIQSFQLNCPKLQLLDLGGNRLTSFVNNSFPNLKILILNVNDLTSFSNNFLPNLQQISLKSNQRLDFYELLYFKNLKQVYISDTVVSTSLINLNLVTWNIFFAEFCSIGSFEKNNMTGLNDLDLSNNPIKRFVNNNLPSLRVLDLSQCSLTEFTGNMIPKLAGLDLSSNSLKDEIANELVNMNMTQIQTVDLRNNSIADPIAVKSLLQTKYPKLRVII